MRTTPTENPHIWDEPRFQNTDVRRITHWGMSGDDATPIAAPGKYTVRLTIDGKPYTQPFTVVKDPAISSSDADLVESTKMQVRVSRRHHGDVRHGQPHGSVAEAASRIS